jgi:hypothetical protein
MSFNFFNAAQILEMNIFSEVRENKSVLHVYPQLVFDFEEKINIKFLVASVTKHLLILSILLKAATEFYSVISLFFLSQMYSYMSYPAFGLFSGS